MQDKKKGAQIISPGLGDIEKVRDILFGKTVSQFEARLQELEEQMEEQVNRLASMVDNKMSELDARIENEVAQRSKALEEMNQAAADSHTRTQHAISELELEAGERLAALRQELDGAQSELSEQLANVERGLDRGKVSKQGLAVLLNELALRLNQEK